MVRRVASLLLALVAWAWSAGVLAAAMLWGLALRCDDACSGEGWRRSEEGWQWNGIVALGAITFAAGSAFVVSVALRRRGLAGLSLIVGFATFIALATALSPNWPDNLDNTTANEALIYVAGVTAPVAAVVFTPRRGSR